MGVLKQNWTIKSHTLCEHEGAIFLSFFCILAYFAPTGM